MKGNSKKLDLFVIFAAIAMFTVVATAAADDQKWRKAIEGEYGVTSSGNCLYSTGGFNANYTPIGSSWPGSSLSTGTWTFHHNGTGTVQGTAFGLTLPPNPNPSASSQKFSFNFEYKVTDDGQITAHMVGPYNGEFLTGTLAGWTATVDIYDLFGYVSADKKTIALGNANEAQSYIVTPPAGINASPIHLYSICNFSRVLIRVDE